MIPLGMYKLYSKAGEDRHWIVFQPDTGPAFEVEITGVEWAKMARVLAREGAKQEQCGTSLYEKYTYYSLLPVAIAANAEIPTDV